MRLWESWSYRIEFAMRFGDFGLICPIWSKSVSWFWTCVIFKTYNDYCHSTNDKYIYDLSRQLAFRFMYHILLWLFSVICRCNYDMWLECPWEYIYSTDPFQQTPELHMYLKDSNLAESIQRLNIHKIFLDCFLPAFHFTSSRIND